MWSLDKFILGLLFKGSIQGKWSMIIYRKGPVVHSSPRKGISDTAPLTWVFLLSSSIHNNTDPSLKLLRAAVTICPETNGKEVSETPLPHTSPPLFTAPNFGLSLNVLQSASVNVQPHSASPPKVHTMVLLSIIINQRKWKTTCKPTQNTNKTKQNTRTYIKSKTNAKTFTLQWCLRHLH